MNDRVTVTSHNVDKLISEYLQQLRELPSSLTQLIETTRDNPYALVEAVKRRRLGVGRYPEVSFFELSNRIGADLVALLGVRSLLGEKALPFEEYTVALGTQQGPDITADFGVATLRGEAFNVAESFFATKKRKAVQVLAKEKATHKLLIFNSDAVRKSDDYHRQAFDGVLYWVVNVSIGIDRINGGRP